MLFRSVEAGVSALQPMMIEDDTLIGFEPPSLTSLRCDMLRKVGELENAPRPSKEWNKVDDKVEESQSTKNIDASMEPSDNSVERSGNSSFSSSTTPRDYLSL